ncbi:MAG: response regulator transcription factor [Acidimicrobiales bacterium]
MRVLVVEDEVNIARALEVGLRSEGFEVEVEHTGDAGLWRAREGSFDAIILDLMLPKLNGYKVCAQLRSEGDRTPILMLTAKDGEFDQIEGFETGADDYVTKPFSFPIVVARLRALIRRGAVMHDVQLTQGDLRLDTRTAEAWRADTPLDLTAREFRLLEALLSTDGAAISKQELLDRVWGTDFPGGPNIVEVYIRYLRQKVDEPFDRRSITTVRGIGYRLIDDLGSGR